MEISMLKACCEGVIKDLETARDALQFEGIRLDDRAKNLDAQEQAFDERAKILKAREDALSQVRQQSADRLAQIHSLKDNVTFLNQHLDRIIAERNEARTKVGNLEMAIAKMIGNGVPVLQVVKEDVKDVVGQC